MRWRWTVWCWGLIGGLSALAPEANASFIGTYALNNFTLFNQNADGSAATFDGGLSAVLTGGNTGSGVAGFTDLFITAPVSGMVHFQFSYLSLDTPTWDDAGYLIDGVYTQLADTDGDFGTADFPISAGQSFGFRVNTLDNEGEPGILTVSDFNAPEPSSGGGSVGTPPAPEPATWPVLLVVLSAAAFRLRKEVRL
jgi:hypothetical protein